MINVKFIHSYASRGGSWHGHRFHLGTNKEVLGAEVFAIYQAFKAFDEAQGYGHR